MKNLLLLLGVFITLFKVYGQNLIVPDANFKAYLLGNAAINTNGDSEIQLSEAQNFKGAITCTSLNISDLTGIEYFTELTYLDCYDNKLTSLDVSKNTALTTLYFDNNLISNIDVSNNRALTKLGFGHNTISSIDLSQNLFLTKLICNANQLINLDLSNNSMLTTIGCYGNQLLSLNLKNGNNANIKQITAVNNPNLKCIQVDDVTFSNTNWSSTSAFAFDNGVGFDVNCNSTLKVIDTKSVFDKIIVFPNPTSNIINFSIESNVILTNINGQVIRNDKKVSTMNLLDQPSGIYFLTITDVTGEIIQHIKIVKD